MALHPYQELPDYCFWSRSIARKPASEIDPVIDAKFPIKPTERVVTAGSCFAQHIGRHLAASNFNYFVTETVHPLVWPGAEEYGYGLFSARYGNIYTSRQLIQLLQRAYGLLHPQEDIWWHDSRVIDPFRPRIQPNGFACIEEFDADRRQHLAAVRHAFDEMDVFVFTLGLTEGYVSRFDGVAFPLCPGVAGGQFEASRHKFINLSVAEVVADLSEVNEFIRVRNPKARIVLTVSPVPLAATMEDRSVLVSTTYSKSVLRVAAEELASHNSNVAYFPSYEIITGSFSRASYFADDLRSVTEAGVAHVMRLFMKYYGARAAPQEAQTQLHDKITEDVRVHERAMENIVAVMCDEETLDRPQ
jgi:hypothetical protein